LLLPLAHGGERRSKQIDIEPACQAAVARDNKEADTLSLAFDEIGMLVFGMSIGQMAYDAPHLVGIGTCRVHALLRLAHLARGDHLHSLGDLLGILDALDLVTDLSFACHA
jgi:hypothetical protein